MADLTLANVLSDMPETKGNVNSLHFRQATYNRWAVVEIFKFIDSHPEWPTDVALDKFSALMDRYIEESCSQEMRWIFCVAKDEAAYLYDWYIAEKIRIGEYHVEAKEEICSKQFGSTRVIMRY